MLDVAVEELSSIVNSLVIAHIERTGVLQRGARIPLQAGGS